MPPTIQTQEEQKKEEKRLEELKKAEKKAEEEALKEKSKINLTKFFNVLPKQEEEEKIIAYNNRERRCIAVNMQR